MYGEAQRAQKGIVMIPTVVGGFQCIFHIGSQSAVHRAGNSSCKVCLGLRGNPYLHERLSTLDLSRSKLFFSSGVLVIRYILRSADSLSRFHAMGRGGQDVQPRRLCMQVYQSEGRRIYFICNVGSAVVFTG